MKKKWTLPAIILVEIGIYFLCKQLNITLYENMYSWPTLFILFGIAFFIQSALEHQPYHVLPASLLTGFGIHFLIGASFSFWPDDLVAFLWIISIGLYLQGIKTRSGRFQATALLIIGLILYFLSSIIELLNVFEQVMTLAESYWPFIFILLGLYLLLIQRR